jgi:hypothetical protein
MSVPAMHMGETEEPELPVEVEEKPGPDKRKLLLLVGALAVVAFGIGFALMQMSGSTPAAKSTPKVTAVASKKPVASSVPQPRTYTGATGRDPFSPLPSPKPTSAPQASAAPELAAAPSPAANQSGGGPTIRLSKVASGVATFSVDGRKYTAAEGETFAQTFKLYNVFNDKCVGVLYGDQNVAMCLGDSQSL